MTRVLKEKRKMATARLYARNEVPAKKEIKGQAAVIMDVLLRQNGEPKLAADLAKQVEAEGNLKTRQDVLRVTLYYIIVFKGMGLIATCEQERADAAAPTTETTGAPAAALSE
jgi:hypothetical protein